MYFCVFLHSPENGVKQIEPAHDPLPANAVRLPLLHHYVQDELQAEGGAERARSVAPQGQLPHPAPAQLLHRRQAHVRDSSVAIGALDQH